jgi:hypothetical protein
MTLNDLEVYDLIHADCDLWRRAEVEAIRSAAYVRNENPIAANHAARLVWANAVLADPATWVQGNKVNLLTYPDIIANGNQTTDAQMAYALAVILGAVA